MTDIEMTLTALPEPHLEGIYRDHEPRNARVLGCPHPANQDASELAGTLIDTVLDIYHLVDNEDMRVRKSKIAKQEQYMQARSPSVPQ